MAAIDAVVATPPERAPIRPAPARPATRPAFTVRGGVGTVPGHRRSVNEDAAVCGPTWFGVADGMGGHADGEVASRLAIDTLERCPAPAGLADLHTLCDTANARIVDAAHRAATPGMGTTLVAATALDDGVAIVHIGDSRCYRLDRGVLTQVTRDHSHVQELVDLGVVAPDEAATHRLRHVVTRALGADVVARPDVLTLPGPAGRLLLCSDGLTAELSHRTIGRVLAGVPDPQAAADRLVELARLGPARDDATAVVVDHVMADPHDARRVDGYGFDGHGVGAPDGGAGRVGAEHIGASR